MTSEMKYDKYQEKAEQEEKGSEDPSDLDHGIKWMTWQRQKCYSECETKHLLIYTSFEILIFFFVVSNISNFCSNENYSFDICFIVYIFGVILLKLIRDERIRRIALTGTIAIGYLLPIVFQNKINISIEIFHLIPFLFLLTGVPLPVILSLAFNSLVAFYIVFYSCIVRYSKYKEYQLAISLITLLFFCIQLCIGLIFYFHLLVISSVVESIYQQPSIALRFIPKLVMIERQAFANLPVAFLINCTQDIALEEHMFFLLRLFQHSEFRNLLLQLFHCKFQEMRNTSKKLKSCRTKKRFDLQHFLHDTVTPYSGKKGYSRFYTFDASSKTTVETHETLKRYLRESVIQFFLETYPNKILRIGLLQLRSGMVSTKYLETALVSYNRHLEKNRARQVSAPSFDAQTESLSMWSSLNFDEQHLLPSRAPQLEVVQCGRCYSLVQLYPEGHCSDDIVSLVRSSSYVFFMPVNLLEQLRKCLLGPFHLRQLINLLCDYKGTQVRFGLNRVRQWYCTWWKQGSRDSTHQKTSPEKKFSQVVYSSHKQCPTFVPTQQSPVTFSNSQRVAPSSVYDRQEIPAETWVKTQNEMELQNGNQGLSSYLCPLYFSTWILSKYHASSSKKPKGKHCHYSRRNAFLSQQKNISLNSIETYNKRSMSHSCYILKDVLCYRRLHTVLRYKLYKDESKVYPYRKTKTNYGFYSEPYSLYIKTLKKLGAGYKKLCLIIRSLWNLSLHIHVQKCVPLPHQESTSAFSDTRIERWFLIWSCYLEALLFAKLNWTHYVASFLQILLYMISEALYQSVLLNKASKPLYMSQTFWFNIFVLFFHVAVVFYVMLYNRHNTHNLRHTCHLYKIRNLLLVLVNLFLGEVKTYFQLLRPSIDKEALTQKRQFLLTLSVAFQEISMSVALLSIPLICFSTEKIARYNICLISLLTFIVSPICILIKDTRANESFSTSFTSSILRYSPPLFNVPRFVTCSSLRHTI